MGISRISTVPIVFFSKSRTDVMNNCFIMASFLSLSQFGGTLCRSIPIERSYLNRGGVPPPRRKP